MLKFSQADNRRKTSSCAVYVCVLTLRLPEVINMKLLSSYLCIIQVRRILKLIEKFYLDLRQNSHNYDSLQGNVLQLEERIISDISGVERLRIYRTLSWKVSFCFHLSHCTLNSSSPLKF